MNDVKWYERGEVGDKLRDLLDFYDTATFANEASKLGLSDDEIVEVLMREEEYENE